MSKLLTTMLLMAAISLLPGCTAINEAMGLPVNKGNGYTIKQEKQIYGGGVHVEYRDKTFLEEEVRIKMNNRMASESDTRAELNRLPSGGRVIITYEKLTIEAANTKWLEYVVMKDGVEILRKNGADRIAEVPKSSSSSIRYWWNMDVVDIPNSIGNSFEFIVISNLDNKRDTFTVSAQ